MKKLFMTITAAGFLFAGCSSSDVEEYNLNTPDAIRITATTTRAAVSDYAALENSATGVKVWTKKNNTSGWFIGGVNYQYGTSWGWAGGALYEWPSEGSLEYPMQFFAVFPAAAVTGKTSFMPTTVNTPTLLNQTVSVEGRVTGLADKTTKSSESQLDILAAAAVAVAEKPASGYLPLDFKHILSKVNVGVITGTGATVHVQSVAIRNVKYSQTYKYADASNTYGWTGTPLATLTGFNYLVVGENRAAFAPGNGTTAVPVFAASADRNLMLLPQTGTSWDVTTTTTAANTLTTGAYIEVVYRLTKSNSEIGYTDARNYLTDNPTFVDNPSTTGWSYSTIANYGNKPFFIKVGFPLAAGDFTWEPGHGYTYNIMFGTTDAINGNYTDNTYYDDKGDDTGIEIKKEDGSDDPVIPGEPVTTNYIYFNLSVTNFTDETKILE